MKSVLIDKSSSMVDEHVNVISIMTVKIVTFILRGSLYRDVIALHINHEEDLND